MGDQLRGLQFLAVLEMHNSKRSNQPMRTLKVTGLFFIVLCVASFAIAKEKQAKAGPIAGTWECMSHGSSQGDLPFTLYLEQAKEDISGSVSSPMGGTQISSGTFKKRTLEIEINTPQANYKLTGQLKKGKLSGEWSSENEKGSWEGKKQAAAAQ
jgi:hypothetical protein